MKLPPLACTILSHVAYLPNWKVTESGNEKTYTYDAIIPINSTRPDIPVGVSFTIIEGDKNA